MLIYTLRNIYLRLLSNVEDCPAPELSLAGLFSFFKKLETKISRSIEKLFDLN